METIFSNFESKINSLISKVAWSVGIDVGDRLTQGAKKVKFVVNGPLPNDNEFPSFRDFDVCHHYLQTASRMLQSRLRKRGCNGKWSYTHTIRKVVSGQTIEVKGPKGALSFKATDDVDPTMLTGEQVLKILFNDETVSNADLSFSTG